ncbi:glycosyltransferase [Herpetosiphon geysericola]|uniref:glycosyltransferase n=1 Tax=Herpetosiphon geysericola TaxID=70996 RepID=UPI0006C90C5E|nr:glycosyltransferase [Herpetosiphon geysericola]
MIFVSVGTRPEPFDRLVQAMDCVAAQIDETVIIQTGHTRAGVQYAQARPWLNDAEYRRLMVQARIVISQAGAGSILMARQYARPLIVVARARHYAECPDDHQAELATAVEQIGYAQYVRDITPEALRDAMHHALYHADDASAASRLVPTIRHYLAQWDRPTVVWFPWLRRKGS